jgi:hypothetical protein
MCEQTNQLLKRVLLEECGLLVSDMEQYFAPGTAKV